MTDPLLIRDVTWAIIAALSILIACTLKFKAPVTAAMSFIALLAVVKTKMDMARCYYSVHVVVIFVASYIAAGATCSLIKWYLFLLERRDKYRETHNRFLAAAHIKGDSMPPEMKNRWDAYVRSKNIDRPRAADHKGIIISWMVYWPWSILWMVVDVIRRVFNSIYSRISKLFDMIAHRVYSSLNDTQ